MGNSKHKIDVVLWKPCSDVILGKIKLFTIFFISDNHIRTPW